MSRDRRLALTIACYRDSIREILGDDYALPEVISDTEQHLRVEDKDFVGEVPSGGFDAVVLWKDDDDD